MVACILKFGPNDARSEISCFKACRRIGASARFEIRTMPRQVFKDPRCKYGAIACVKHVRFSTHMVVESNYTSFKSHSTGAEKCSNRYHTRSASHVNLVFTVTKRQNAFALSTHLSSCTPFRTNPESIKRESRESRSFFGEISRPGDRAKTRTREKRRSLNLKN